MKFLNATRKYEAWLGRHTRLIRADLALKHLSMAEEVFPFLRATFYRWMQLCPEVAADAAKAPALLAVGDLHVENFGTWRDADPGDPDAGPVDAPVRAAFERLRGLVGRHGSAS